MTYYSLYTMNTHSRKMQFCWLLTNTECIQISYFLDHLTEKSKCIFVNDSYRCITSTDLYRLYRWACTLLKMNIDWLKSFLLSRKLVHLQYVHVNYNRDNREYVTMIFTTMVNTSTALSTSIWKMRYQCLKFIFYDILWNIKIYKNAAIQNVSTLYGIETVSEWK